MAIERSTFIQNSKFLRTFIRDQVVDGNQYFGKFNRWRLRDLSNRVDGYEHEFQCSRVSLLMGGIIR